MKLSDDLAAQFMRQGRIPKEQISDIFAISGRDAVKFAEEIIERGYMTRDKVGPILGDSVNYAYMDLDTTIFHDDVVEMLPKDMAKELEAIPIYKFGSSITVAFSHPDEQNKVIAVEKIIGHPVDPVFSFPDEIVSAIEVNKHTKKEVNKFIVDFDFEQFSNQTDEQIAKAKPIVEMSEALLMLGIKEKASDIHIEPKENDYVIRFRIDGMLREQFRLPRLLGPNLVARFKVMSCLDISERRTPQDGKIAMKLKDGGFDVRVSTLPVTHGEKVVMRLLGSAASGISLDLEKIGLSPHLKDLFKEAISEPNGIVFVTGPTGSGKSTTLYSALHYIDKPGINIMTIEDPVEYQMETITQSQVDAKAGRTFASILRAALRQDPDVILVGEIRDVETAKIASEAALTGHLVISTLHTNNSLQAISRLIEMGVEPHVVAPAIVGVLAQRLARKICEHCIISYKPEAEELEKYFYWDKEMELPMLYKGTGCKYCGGIGYKGRIGIHEFVRINTRLRDRILSHASYNELVKVATEDGFRDMRFDGFCKMLEGQTTLDEVIRVTSTDL